MLAIAEYCCFPKLILQASHTSCLILCSFHLMFCHIAWPNLTLVQGIRCRIAKPLLSAFAWCALALSCHYTDSGTCKLC